MEINEFLTRISLSDAEPTIFTLYEKGKNVTPSGKELFFDNRTLKTYTKSKENDCSITGYINYDNPFPKQIFAMDPKGLNDILSEADNMDIDDTYLVARGNMDFRWKLDILGKAKTLELQYNNHDIPLTKETIAKIIRADSIVKATNVSVTSDGKGMITVNVFERIKDTSVKIEIPVSFEYPPVEALYERRFIDCLKLVGSWDAVMNLDGKRSGMEKPHGHGKIEIKDDTAKITYYIAEVTRTINEERRTSKQNATEKQTTDKQFQSPPDENKNNGDAEEDMDSGSSDEDDINEQ